MLYVVDDAGQYLDRLVLVRITIDPSNELAMENLKLSGLSLVHWLRFLFSVMTDCAVPIFSMSMICFVEGIAWRIYGHENLTIQEIDA